MIRKLAAVALFTLMSGSAAAQSLIPPGSVQMGMNLLPTSNAAGLPAALAFPGLTLVGLGFASYSPATAVLFDAAAEYAPLVIGPVNSAVPLPVIGQLYN